MKTLFRAAVASLAILISQAAFATPVCFPWKDALKLAHDKFGEIPAYIAYAEGAGVFTVTLNPDTGSWTLFVQPTPDKMCVVVSGDGWEEAPDSVKNVARPGT